MVLGKPSKVYLNRPTLSRTIALVSLVLLVFDALIFLRLQQGG